MNLIIPNSLKQITDNIDLYDGVILSIEGFSVNTLYTITLNELDDIITYLDEKEVFICLNKNIENHELSDLERILLELNRYNIKGVLYSDVAVVTYKDNLNYDLVWAAEHLTTNYETINYWQGVGVNYCYLSSDITLKEVNTIRKNTSVKLMFNIFGYIPMFTSKRYIIKNYLDRFNLKDKSKVNYMEKEGKMYPIFDKNLTTALTDTILNGINEYYNINVDYFVINGILISDVEFSEVLKIIKNITKDNAKNSYLKINKMFNNTSSLFMYQETLTRVKK